jgi:hypothetical protein
MRYYVSLLRIYPSSFLLPKRKKEKKRDLEENPQMFQERPVKVV